MIMGILLGCGEEAPNAGLWRLNVEQKAVIVAEEKSQNTGKTQKLRVHCTAGDRSDWERGTSRRGNNAQVRTIKRTGGRTGSKI